MMEPPQKRRGRRGIRLSSDDWSTALEWLESLELVRCGAVSRLILAASSRLVVEAEVSSPSSGGDNWTTVADKEHRVAAVTARFSRLQRLTVLRWDFTATRVVAPLVVVHRGGWGSRPAHAPRPQLPAEAIARLSSTLLSLDLSRNKLSAVPSPLFALHKLTLLNISSNPIAWLSPRIAELTSLQVLMLESTVSFRDVAGGRGVLKQLPDEIGALGELRELHLGRNGIAMLPASVGNLRNLCVLNLGSQCLRSGQHIQLPPELGRLTGLTALVLSEMPRCWWRNVLPPTLWTLASLARLNVENCLLNELPNELGLLTALTHLHAARNNLGMCPTSIGCCSRLEYIDLGWNISLRLSRELIATLGSLQELIVLNLQGIARVRRSLSLEVHAECAKQGLRSLAAALVAPSMWECGSCARVNAADADDCSGCPNSRF